MNSNTFGTTLLAITDVEIYEKRSEENHRKSTYFSWKNNLQTCWKRYTMRYEKLCHLSDPIENYRESFTQPWPFLKPEMMNIDLSNIHCYYWIFYLLRNSSVSASLPKNIEQSTQGTPMAPWRRVAVTTPAASVDNRRASLLVSLGAAALARTNDLW